MNLPPLLRTVPHFLDWRSFLAHSAAATVSAWLARPLRAAAAPPSTRQATGAKIGELTDRSAIVWTRLTAAGARNSPLGHLSIQGTWRADYAPLPVPPAHELAGACPGAPGRIRVRYGTRENLVDAKATEWIDVGPDTDFTHQFALSNLRPDTPYHFAIDTTGPGGRPEHAPLHGRFHTAPAPDAPSDFLFCATTGQAYHDRDHLHGQPIYPAMLALAPRFLACTGDNVYYDTEQPPATNVELARYHWERLYSLPRLHEFYRNVGAYFQKDDHDTLADDCWRGKKSWDLTFEEGQRLFREQVPYADPPYRSFRWGRDVEIWLTDVRDYRSPNTMPDGPEKTILGREQKEWLKRTLVRSTATWKLLISPTPIVGPDRARKSDNHANASFQHEGDELRAWFRANVPDNFAVICGDRHWQYHSIHPQTGLEEFSVGPTSDSHAGGSPGQDPEYHRFHRMKGGFLSVRVRPEGNESMLLLQHHDVNGNVVYRVEKRRRVGE